MLSGVLKAVDAINRIKLKSTPLPALYFHRVLASKTAFCPDDWHVDDFKSLINKLSKHFTLLSLEHAMVCLEDQTLPTNALCLTFDDGYEDNFELAAPIIESVGGKASFFIASQGTERGYLWNDILLETVQATKKKELPFDGETFSLCSEDEKAHAYLTLVAKLKTQPNDKRDADVKQLQRLLGNIEVERCMMTKAQLIELQRRGHTIGGHTHTHSILAYQSEDQAQFEIEHSVTYLNECLPTRVTCFAYPNGWFKSDFNEHHESMVQKCGIQYGFATNDGGITRDSCKTRLPRFMPYRKELNQFCISVKKIAGEKLND